MYVYQIKNKIGIITTNSVSVVPVIGRFHHLPQNRCHLRHSGPEGFLRVRKGVFYLVINNCKDQKRALNFQKLSKPLAVLPSHIWIGGVAPRLPIIDRQTPVLNK